MKFECSFSIPRDSLGASFRHKRALNKKTTFAPAKSRNVVWSFFIGRRRWGTNLRSMSVEQLCSCAMTFGKNQSKEIVLRSQLACWARRLRQVGDGKDQYSVEVP